jgi:hypothetical protein
MRRERAAAAWFRPDARGAAGDARGHHPARMIAALGVLHVALLGLALSAPLVAAAAALLPGRASLAVLKLHAAAHLAAFALAWVALMHTVDGGSPGTGLLLPIMLGLSALLGIELLVLGVLAARRRATARWLFTGTLGCVLGLAGLGATAWSWSVPGRVIASAEAVAGDAPYCVISAGRVARGRGDITGRAMRVTATGGMAFGFHGLLLVETPQGLRHFNWSYRLGGFQPVRPDTVAALRLDLLPRCPRVPHAARGWA